MSTQTAPVTANTVDRVVEARALTRYDLDVLSRISVVGYALRDSTLPGWWKDETVTPGEKAAEWTAARLSGETAVIAYEGEFGVGFGVARCRYPAGYAGRTEDTFSVSPFPGAWEEVPLSKIVAVRHASTL